METQDSNYKKRTQKDYSLSLKLQIVQEIEQGLLTTTGALDKYGVQSASTVRVWLKKYDYDKNNHNLYPLFSAYELVHL